MSFEGRNGEHGAEFVARASGYSVSLSRREIKLQFATQRRQVTPEVVHISFAGADEKAQAEPEEALPGVIHYYIGNDPSRWRTDVRRFRQVRFRDIYPGTGLVFYGSRQLGDFNELEFDFEVAPGHEVNAIRMMVEGAAVQELDGNLELATPSGNVAVLKKPEVYQLRGGHREPVRGGYVVRNGNEIGFSVPAYDKSLPLIIDPALGYSTLVQHLLEATLFAGQFPTGAGFLEFDSINGIAVDSSGNTYLTGEASAPDPSLGFQGTPPLPLSNIRVSDAFVVKLDPTGSSLVYAAYLGGNPSAIVESSGSKVALDSGNNAYIVGTTNSPSFVTTLGAFSRSPVCPVETLSNMNCSETFAAKFDATGHLVFSTYLVTGGSTDTAGPSLGSKRIAVDSTGAVYVAGDIFPALFVFPKDPAPPSVAGLTVTPGAFQTTRKNNRSAYVLKLHPDGSTLDYSTYLGGSGNGNLGETIGGIAVDAAGVAYVDGATASADFPTTAGAFQTSNTGTAAFFSKVQADGSALLYSTFLGAPTLTSQATAIALDSSNNTFIGGNTSGPGFPTTPGVFNPNVTGTGTFNFVSEFDTTGNLALSTYIGSADTTGVAVDATGIYVAGVTASPTYPALNSIEPPPVAGEAPMYVTKLNLTGTALVYSTFIGTTVEGMTGMAVDPGQNVYLSGGAFDAFPTTVGAFQTLVDLIGNPFPSPFVTKLVPSLGAAVPVVAPRALKFTQALQQGVASTPLTVRLSNFGDADLNLVNISIAGTNPGDFSQTNNCPAILPGGTNCTVTVVFTPTVPSGARSASLIFTFGGGFAAQSVSLNGTAGTPVFQITPVPGDFGTFGQLENSITNVTITNVGTGPLILAGASLTPPGNFPNTDFSFGSTNAGPAPQVLQPGQSTPPFALVMHVGLNFGTLTAQFRVDDNTQNSPHIFQLTGFGFKTTPDFAMSTPNGVPATATVTAGQTATYNVVVAALPSFGFGGGSSISMSCTGAPTGAACNLDRTLLPLPDSNPETVVASVSTTAASASLQQNVAPWWWGVAAFGIVLMLPGKKSRSSVLAAALLLAMFGTFAGCGGGNSSANNNNRGGNLGPPTPAGTYTLTVTASSGSVSHTFPLTLVVK